MNGRANQLHAIENGLYEGRGEGHGRAKLTEEQVREIRRQYVPKYGEQTRLAKEYGVSQALIAKIVRGDIWTHLDDCPEQAPVVSAGQMHKAQLSEVQVREIRERYSGRYGEQTTLAREYGVSVHAVRKALKGETWKVLKGTRVYSKPQGERHGRAKLSENKVRWMRHLHSEKGWTVKALAERYGITAPIARDVIFGKTWKHIE